MNRAFRIVWSHARNAFVIADEHASSRGKSSGACCLLAVLGLGLVANDAQAIGICSSGSNTISSAETSQCYLTPGSSLLVTSTGSIDTASDAVLYNSMSSMGSITNNGHLTGGLSAILLNAGESGTLSVDTINNNFGATLEGTANSGLYAYGPGINEIVIGEINNAGTMTGGPSGGGMWLYGATVSGAINNSGTMTGSNIGAILDESSALYFNNSGTISTPYAGLWLQNDSYIGQLSNSGRIDGPFVALLLSNSEVDQLSNSGTISSTNFALGAVDGSRISRLDNSGTISGFTGIVADGLIGTFDNSGLITGTGSTGYGIYLTGDAAVDTLNNTGTISGVDTGIAIGGNAQLAVLNNSGTISGDRFAIATPALGSSLPQINITGTQARLIGDVAAQDSTLTLKTGADFATENAVYVDRIVIENGATLRINEGISSSGIENGDGIQVANGLSNAGTLSVAAGKTGMLIGDYSQSAGGALKIGVASDDSYGKLQVSGTATLASNAKIVVDVSNPNYNFSAQSLQDVLSAGTLNSDGSFSVTDNSLLFNFDAIKDGNTVDLTLSKATTVLQSVINTGNSPARGAARVLDGAIDEDPNSELASHFVGLTDEQEVSDAVTQTLPTVAGNTGNAIGNTLDGINRVIQARQDSNSGLSSGDPVAQNNLWIKTFGSWADQDERSGISGYDADTRGLAIGLDAPVNEAARIGLAFAYAKTDLDNDSSVAPQNADIDTYQLIAYGSYALSADTELNAQLDGGQNRIDSTRHMPFAASRADADYDGHNFHAGIGLAHNLRLNEQLSFVPSVRADYTWIESESYREKGAGALNLDVDSSDAEALLLSVDGKLNYALTEATLISAHLGAGYDVIDEDSSITSTYAGAPGAAFKTPGLDLEPWVARAGLGLSHTLPSGTEVSLRYDTEARSDFTNQGASLKARWAF